MLEEDGLFELVFYDCVRLLAKLYDDGEVEYQSWSSSTRSYATF
jgi:hypothetical protein